MNKPKVTVITPSYNKPQYVGDAIRSVLNQTYKNFEYIIVENSTDLKTKDIVKKFKDKRIKYFNEVFSDAKRKKVYIPAYILNKYYEKAKGEYIFYLSDDDILLKDCLKVMLNFFLSNASAKVCFHDQLIIYEDEKKIIFEPLARGTNQILSFKNKNPKGVLDGGQIMFKKEILKGISKPYLPVDWNRARNCDNIFMEKISLRNAFFPVGKILSIHRVVPLTTHRRRNPLKYTIYRFAAMITPEFIQSFLGQATGKRRQLTKKEKNLLKKIKKNYLVNRNI